MVDSSSHKPSSLEITPKEEHVTLDKPESPNPFLPTDHVEFIFKEIAFTTKNEVALLYSSHPNSEYFREVSYFISKCFLKEAFDRARTQYKQYLSEFWYTAKTLGGIKGDIGYNGEIKAKGTLKKSCIPPRVKVDYARLISEDIIHKLSKKTREKVVPYPRFISLLLEYIMPEYENEDLTINPTQMFLWTPKLINLHHKLRRFPKAKSLELKVDSEEQSSKHTFESKTVASKSKTGQSKKETQSSSAKDKSPSHPSPSTLVVGEIHKEAQKGAGGPTSLGATNKDGAHPQLSSGHDASVDSTTEADPGLSAPNDSIHSQQGTNKESRADEISKKIKLEDLLNLLKDTRSTFFTPDSPHDEPIIISDESEVEEEVNKDKDTHASSYDPELFKLLASHNFASCLPTKLKELPSKFTELSIQIKELKKHVKDMEIKLPGDLKEILTKLETFTSTISSLTSQVAKLKDIQWELLAELQAFPVLFATMVENASGATTKDVPSVGQASASPAEGEKNTTKAAKTNRKKNCSDRRRLVRDDNTIKVFLKHLILEFCSILVLTMMTKACRRTVIFFRKVLISSGASSFDLRKGHFMKIDVVKVYCTIYDDVPSPPAQRPPLRARMGYSPNCTLEPSNSFEWHKTVFEIVTSMVIRHAKALNPSRLSKTWQSFKHPKNSLISMKPDRAHICTISGAIHRRKKTHNEDRRTELEYFSEDYDEEREMEPRPEQTREVTPPLRTRSPRGNKPLKAGAEENGKREMNLPLLLAAHLGRK
ncbi:hypothetical protein Tco_0642913 [Tanacetum coccineum]